MSERSQKATDALILNVGQTLLEDGHILAAFLDIEDAPPPKKALDYSPAEIAAAIDHTNLKPNAMKACIAQLCDEALEHGFAAVCVNPIHVKTCARMLAGAPVAVATVVGFPLGATPGSVKAFEAKSCIGLGADELDMVVNVGALKDGDWAKVKSDIGAVVQASGDKLVKVILETCWLTSEEIIAACLLSRSAGADFVKTSTGFGPAGATVEHVRLMRRVVGTQMGVKAAGGIRTALVARELLAAGATRLGASASIDLIQPIR